VGHGLKDIGSRESYVIRLPRGVLTDTAAEVERAFDVLWPASTPITT
jgi:hypothetical protein